MGFRKTILSLKRKSEYVRRKTDSAKAFLAKGVSAKILNFYLHVIYEFLIK
jgi:hypothetical protein